MPVAKQALGYIEEKLRRVFRLAGPIGLELDPRVTTTVIADDLRDPGHAFYQGRSWAWSFNMLGDTPGATKYTQLKCNNDVVIEAFAIYGAVLPAAAFVVAYVGAPTQAVPNDATFLTGAWRDNKDVAADQPPLEAAASFAAPLVGTDFSSNNVILTLGPGTIPPGVIPMKLYLPAGGWIGFAEQGLTNLTIHVWGRVWPQ